LLTSCYHQLVDLARSGENKHITAQLPVFGTAIERTIQIK
jgi:hypothetical protein